MTIYELLDYCSDKGLCKVAIFNLDEGMVVWKGWGSEVPEKFENCKVVSFDAINSYTPAALMFNINNLQ